MGKYQSYAGFFGAVAVIMASLFLMYLKTQGIITTITNDYIFLIVTFTFAVMLISEYFLKRRYDIKYAKRVKFSSLSRSNLYILKSSIFRFIALFVPFLFFYAVLQNHYYFILDNRFIPTRELADYYLYIFLIAGVPYIFLTLKFRGDSRYEIGDYALLTIVGIKSIFLKLFGDKKRVDFFKNRRVKKVALLYLVNFFFWTLMVRFAIQEFSGFDTEYFMVFAPAYDHMNWFNQFRHWYLLLFHLIFVIDVSIAIIGYSFASRWLGNRTKSVDATLSGWVVALMCYPPLNTGFTSQFISYNGLETHQLIRDPYIMTAILILLFILYSIYVLSTASLGFKFSNLTNRGIVSIGPYSIVRHPAYVSKNLSWWIDNTFVLTNIWATVAMVLWNGIYIARALTEERHLQKDRAYIEYRDKVKYMFIPKVI